MSVKSLPGWLQQSYHLISVDLRWFMVRVMTYHGALKHVSEVIARMASTKLSADFRGSEVGRTIPQFVENQI